MHEQKSTGTSEMKAFGQDLLDLGVRYAKAGKAWLNYRRNEMSHENSQNGNRQQDRQHQQSREANRNEQAGQSRYGQYRGSDYDDLRAEGESDFGTGRQFGQQGDASTQRYSGYSENGGDRAQNLHSHNRQRGEDAGRDGQENNFRSTSGQSQNTGGYGGYADEQDSRGRSQSGSRRNAQDQYGDPRGQGGSSQGSYGQSGQADSGQDGSRQNNYGQSAQGIYGQNNDGRSGHRIDAQNGYGQSGQHGEQMSDRESTKGHRGKGPRSYSRSDERLTEDLNEQLMHDDDIDASDISVRVESGEVTLEGTVTERWMKHRAEDLVERCSGVKDVDNRIRVKKSGAGGSDGNESSSSMKSSANGTNGGFDGSAGAVGT